MKFDVVVIGGGHAGCEAAHAAARLGTQVALLTLNPGRIGFMSCNPAMGGLAKGQLVKEIDALGGLMGRVTDQAAIQYRRLNESKGPAVRSSRAQCDKEIYAVSMQQRLRSVQGIEILEAEAADLVFEGRRVTGVSLGDGTRLTCRAVVVTSGTFLGAVMHVGGLQTEGGRIGDRSSKTLSGALSRLDLGLRRLKTGTPPRLLRQSIDFSKLEEQPGDLHPTPFSFFEKGILHPRLPQVSCHITYTNAKTHEIIDKNIHFSPMYSGAITGQGPRYCPSIEDKVKRFRDRDRHQLFIEPETLSSDEMYINGISTSLPQEVQGEFVRSISGLERAEFARFGYAVEYDAIDSRKLRATLESKDHSGLYFAGQINGTSGYEEAGAQGLVAGLNAALAIQERDPFVPLRSDGYIGVLVDDLVLKGADEPYRMFTSRAEYRLLLREDNADLRLSPLGHRFGLLSDEDFAVFEAKKHGIESLRARLDAFWVNPGSQVDSWLEERGQPPLRDRASGTALLRRPEVNWEGLRKLGFLAQGVDPATEEQVQIQVKYEGYIRRDLEILEGVRKSEAIQIPLDLDFEAVPGLSNEVRSRFRETRPETLGQASRMPGITPAAVGGLLVYLKGRGARSVSVSNPL